MDTITMIAWNAEVDQNIHLHVVLAAIKPP
jgi:hypothetical protein